MQAKAGAHPQTDRTIAPRARAVEVSGSALERAFALSEQLEEALSQTQAELKEVPALIRPMAAGSFKREAGQSVSDWIEMARALSVALSSQDEAAAERLATEFPDLRASLQRLQTYYHEAPAESAKRVRDEAVRREMGERMAHREAVVGALISALDEIP
jgi:hypothetical protein